MNWHGSGYLGNIGKLTYNGSRKEQEKGVHMSTTQPIRSTVQLNQFKKYYLEIFPEERNYALIILGLNTALRISDILQLHVSDVWDCGKNKFRKVSYLNENSGSKCRQFITEVSAYRYEG